MKFKFSGKDALTHWINSSPGRSPGRAIVLPFVLALALASAASALANVKVFTFKIFMTRRCLASYPVPVIGLVKIGSICVFYVYSKGYVYGSLQQCNK